MSSTWAVRGVPGCAPLKSGTKAAGTSVVGCSAGTILIDQSGMAISYNDRLSVAELLTLVQRAFRTGSGAEPTHRRRRPDPERRPRRLGGSTQLAGRSPVTVASGKAIPPARYRNGSDALRARQNQRIRWRSLREIRPVELELGSTAARKSKIADDLVLDAVKNPRGAGVCRQ